MSFKIRRSSERKFFDHGWLKTYHTFSFGSYFDPNFMGFRDLRVINEDRVEPGEGFPLHEHKNMEIVTVLLEGELTHEDSMGNKSKLRAGEVQAMSAGKGIKHSEYNLSNDPVHLLQIWILPEEEGLQPGYKNAKFPLVHNKWVLIASHDGKESSLKIHQDVELLVATLESGKELELKTPSNRYGWLQIIEGEVAFDGELLKKGDGAAIEPNTSLKLKAKSASKLLFFDLK
jgi:redox-sensitive bicupin YhaK (pirin superfamily)